MSVVYFVRHGQSEWNVANKICGATDIPLTAKGHEQAREAAEKILAEGIVFDEILASPLSRAYATAEHIARVTHKPLRVEERLREQCFGKYEGYPRHCEEFELAKQSFINHYDGGESMLQLAQRIYNLLDDLKNDPEGKTYLLVAHNGIARVIQSYFYDMTNEEYGKFGVDNCTVLRYDFAEKA